MADRLDLNTLGPEAFAGADWVTGADLRGSAREQEPQVTFRGPGTLIFNTRAYRMAGDAARANGLGSAPQPTWFHVGLTVVENTYLLLIRPVEPGAPGAVEGVWYTKGGFALTGLHDFFRRHGIDVPSREGRYCPVLGIKDLGPNGHCVVVNFTDGQAFVREEEPEAQAAAADQG